MHITAADVCNKCCLQRREAKRIALYSGGYLYTCNSTQPGKCMKLRQATLWTVSESPHRPHCELSLIVWGFSWSCRWFSLGGRVGVLGLGKMRILIKGGVWKNTEVQLIRLPLMTYLECACNGGHTFIQERKSGLQQCLNCVFLMVRWDSLFSISQCWSST